MPATCLVAALAAPARGIVQLTRVVQFPAFEHEEDNRGRTDLYAKEQLLYEAESYLSAVADRLRGGNVTDRHLGAVCSVAGGKDVAEALIRMAEKGEAVESTGLLGSCDLMAMATHRRGGLQRLAMGSVYDGRVESLFVAIDREQWGTFDPVTHTIHVHQEAKFRDQDLLDIAATQTLLHGGSVYAVERANMPDNALLAAVFRY